jgi:hypothetical protein
VLFFVFFSLISPIEIGVDIEKSTNRKKTENYRSVGIYLFVLKLSWLIYIKEYLNEMSQSLRKHYLK